MEKNVGTKEYETIILKILYLIENGDISVIEDLDIDEEDLCTLALGAYYSCNYKAAKALFKLLQTYDKYAELALKYLKLIWKKETKEEPENGEHSGVFWGKNPSDIKQYRVLLPRYIVTASGINIKCEENKYRPSFSKTKDKAGTKYLIFKTDYAKKIVYTLPLSEVEDKYGYRIAGKKYGKNVPDRWLESIVRVFSIFDLENIVGELKEIDFERALSSAYNSFIFSARCKPIPAHALSFCDYIIEKRRKAVRPGFLLEYKDYSDNPAGVIRSFCVFAVDEANKKYRTFEMRKDGKMRYKIDATSIFEFPMDFHFCSAYLLNDESLKRNMRNFASQFGNDPKTPIKHVVSPLLSCEASNPENKAGFRVGPAGDYPGIPHGTRRHKKEGK